MPDKIAGLLDDDSTSIADESDDDAPHNDSDDYDIWLWWWWLNWYENTCANIKLVIMIYIFSLCLCWKSMNIYK